MSSRWRPTTLRTIGVPEPVVPDRLVVGVDVPVQQQRRLEPPGEPVQGLESLVRRILAVTGAPRRRVREQHVHAAPVPQLPPARPARQRAGPPGLLARRVLVGAIAVAAGAAEPGDAKIGHVHHRPVGVDRAGGPGRPGRQPGLERQPRARGAVAGHVGIVVAGHEHERYVERVHQVAQVVEGKVAAGDDQPGLAHRPHVGVQGVVHLIGHGEDKNHTTDRTWGRSARAGPAGGGQEAAQ